MKNQSKKSSGSIGALIAALCIVIYTFALIYGGVRLYFSFERCRETARYEFNSIKNLAIQTGSQGFLDDRFIQTMHNALMSSRVLEAIIITGPDEDYAIEKQRGRAIAWSGISPRFINRMGFSSETYYEPLPINNIRNANIKAIANAFDYDDISNILKQTLLFILLGFAISFFTMLIQMLIGGKTENQSAAGRASSGYTPTQAAAQSSAPVIHAPSPAPHINAPLHETKSVSSELVPAGTGPKGLYSSRSNIGWEEYTRDRLNAEIHRCASSEKDLTFIMLEFTNNIDEKIYKAIAEDAASILSSKDMLFEYGSRGVCAILPGVDIDAGMVKAEKYLQRINQNYSGYDLNIGLTSRSGRLLDADRLLLESREALHRAKMDTTTSIIAFKSDPDKYRAFISQQG